MRSKLRVEAIVVLVVAAVFLLAGTLKSRVDYMESLPLYKHYKCALCHTSTAPTSGSDLNSFGADFRSNSYIWNATLASKDSDGDGFPNGVELGDEDGDTVPEIGFERSNPGDRLTTPNSVDGNTWGILKSLFQ